jgi:hypothetical protein
MAAALCLLAAVFSWLRGKSGAPGARPLLARAEEGIGRSGEVAMQEAGAGAAPE